MNKVIYSTTNDPTKWANEDFDVINFASEGDAKKAEGMFRAMAAEIERLRTHTEGWKLVPISPTIAMLQAGLPSKSFPADEKLFRALAMSYKAMIEASSSPQESSE